jgi:hypothetical protein
VVMLRHCRHLVLYRTMPVEITFAIEKATPQAVFFCIKFPVRVDTCTCRIDAIWCHIKCKYKLFEMNEYITEGTHCVSI